MVSAENQERQGALGQKCWAGAGQLRVTSYRCHAGAMTSSSVTAHTLFAPAARASSRAWPTSCVAMPRPLKSSATVTAVNSHVPPPPCCCRGVTPAPPTIKPAASVATWYLPASNLTHRRRTHHHISANEHAHAHRLACWQVSPTTTGSPAAGMYAGLVACSEYSTGLRRGGVQSRRAHLAAAPATRPDTRR